MNRHVSLSLTLVICLQWFSLSVQSSETNKAAIATAHPLATYAGFEILHQGGNAFDAAVAISAALAVVEPAGSGLGGGGFWLIHRTKDGFETMIDGREKAPLAAHQDMFLDDQGKVIEGLSKNGALSAGIPGLPAALVHLSKKYGQIPLFQALQPAIQYAENGFQIGERHRRMLRFRLEELRKSEAAARIFLHHNELPGQNALLKQTDLANTLKQIAKQGFSGFYGGEVAEKLVNGVKKAGGIWTRKDLQTYQVVERKPITGEYHDIKITSAALPSSGGIVMMQALNILSGFDLQTVDGITRKHLIVEAMRKAYHDRAFYLGDSDFVNPPVEQLINKHYAAGLRASIRFDKALPSQFLAGDMLPKPKGQDTTHFSVMDKDGNRVAATLSINFPFGSGFVAKGTGVLLNDEMDDFVSKPGELNGYGLTGGSANSIQPGKRMLSSMTPTFVEDKDRIAVLGTPGGSRIISMVLLAVLDFAEGNSPDSWVRVPRFHHQFLPDLIQYEKGGLTEEEIKGLSELGHQLQERPYQYGNMQAVQWNKTTGKFSVASDPRGEGSALIR